MYVRIRQHVLFLDFAKAFYKVNHKILSAELDHWNAMHSTKLVYTFT